MAATGDVVILLGCPATSDAAFWKPLREVVSGRLVNGFSEQDGVLRYLHRVEVAVKRECNVGGRTCRCRTGGDCCGGRGECGFVGDRGGTRRLRDEAPSDSGTRGVPMECLLNKESVKRITMTNDGEMTNKRCALALVYQLTYSCFRTWWRVSLQSLAAAAQSSPQLTPRTRSPSKNGSWINYE